MAVGFEQAHDAFFVGGCEFGKYVGGLNGHRQLGIGHALDVVTHQQPLLLQAHFPANFRRHQFVIASQDFYRNSVFGQRFKRGRGALFRRIKERHITNQRQVLLVCQVVGVTPGNHGSGRHRHYPQPFFVKCCGHLANTRQQLVAQGFLRLAMAHGFAH